MYKRQHVRKRCDLDGAALLILGEIVRAEHVKQSVVQRAQIRVYLALQVAGQKAEDVYKRQVVYSLSLFCIFVKAYFHLRPLLFR